MTFKQAKVKLDNMTQEQFDQNSVLLSRLHEKISKTDKETAEALELAGMAMMLYCNK